MNHYSFFMKAGKVIAIVTPNEQETQKLIAAGYEKQFEEISATTKKNALTRFSDIRRNNRIDHRNFLAGAGTMPLIGILTVVVVFLLRKKQL